eukprot:Em0003g504a
MDSKDDVQILSEAPEVYKAVLVTFRECYNVCCYSSDSILSVHVKKDIEQCGVDFRYICQQTATLAERITSSFIDDSLLFFEDEEVMKSKEMALGIADQAAELAKGFTAIRSWVTNLAGRCNGCIQKISQEKGVHLSNVKKALEGAQQDKRKADMAREAAAKAVQEKEDTQFIFGVASWIPVVNLVALPLYFMARSDTAEAVSEKNKAEETVFTTQTKVTDAECVKQKAQEAAEKLGQLVSNLSIIENICNGQIAFWNHQTDKFRSFEASIRKFTKYNLLQNKTKDLVDWLRTRKVMMERYYDVMQHVISGANIAASLTPTHFQPIRLEALCLTLGSES